VGPVDQVGSHRQALLDGSLLRDGNFMARRDCHRLGGQLHVPGDIASQEATGVCEIGAGRIWRRVAAVADRRVIRDDLLLNQACSVQAGKQRLHGDKARHKTRKGPPSRPSSKRGHA